MTAAASAGPLRVVVVGSGIAGLYAAALAAECPGIEVTLLAKGALETSNTWFAQGGITAVTAQGAAAGDSVQAHAADTFRAGAGMNDDGAVQLLCSAAAGEVAVLQDWGVAFDLDGGRLALGLEGAHSAARILHAGGDRTGARIARVLVDRVRALADAGRLRIREHAYVQRLLLDGNRVTGVEVLEGPQTTRPTEAAADVVILATGGAGQLFEATTNPASATGDGVALAWEAGAVLADLEFIQFHPTLLDPAATGGVAFMISEAVRGEGALLVDSSGRRFMADYDERSELAPRDVVSRAIFQQLRLLEGRGDEPQVYLDATGIAARRGQDFLARRFPTIDRTVKSLGFDWNTVPLPVVPASHYWMGGIRTDTSGRTSLPGLFAVGETACTGVHGANRLASNSLLEGLVFARRAVNALQAGNGSTPVFAAVPLELQNGTVECTPAQVRALMSESAGVTRDAAGLELAAKQLRQWRAPGPCSVGTEAAEAGPAAAEHRNLLINARLVVAAAAARRDSVGAHFRTDFSQPPAGTDSLHFINAGAASSISNAGAACASAGHAGAISSDNDDSVSVSTASGSNSGAIGSDSVDLTGTQAINANAAARRLAKEPA
ncbi:L-aspartate oxidase [Arthrobacter mangrovi]|uniref:L-aspartate oxidase n=1 Tax=Arthrobacter mangrovi TaxID=2966350 RepID=A0ABQ5MWU4_9MICC|nr:L-aspartate oxidase [Arthrobacter mangrovi]GLB68423.1 L-aspartate oxidase [Arthrobacter mangrovi]